MQLEKMWQITKGYLISECNFRVLNFSKNQQKNVTNFCPKNLKCGQINKVKAFSHNIIYKYINFFFVFLENL